MIVKQNLFFNGQYIIVWGPEDREQCYQLFLKEVAKEMGCEITLMVYALQLSDMLQQVTDLQAYIAWSNIQRYIQNVIPTKWKITHQPILQCNEFLQPSSPVASSYPVFTIPKANVAPTPLDQLTETIVNRRSSKSDGIISRYYTIQWMRNIKQQLRFLLQPPTIAFLSVMIVVFGFLLLPIH